MAWGVLEMLKVKKAPEIEVPAAIKVGMPVTTATEVHVPRSPRSSSCFCLLH